MKEILFTELVIIREPRFPFNQGTKQHLVFNADCDISPFTIFPEMPGYSILQKMIYIGKDSCKCKMKWTFYNDHYNRCEGLEFDVDDIKYIDKKFQSMYRRRKV